MSREAIVLLQVNGLIWNLVHVKCPEHTRDTEPNLSPRNKHSRANTATESDELFSLKS